MPSGRTALTAVACGLCVWLARPAHAQDKAIRFSWDAPAPCPSADSVANAAVRLLGGTTEGTRRVSAQARVRRQGSRWHLTLATEVDGEKGQRDLEADTCGDIADAVAVILALSHDPEAIGVVPPEPRPPPVPAPPPPPPPPSPPSSQAVPPPTSEEDDDDLSWIGGSVAALVSLDGGAMPDLGVGFGGAVGLQLDFVRIELSGAYFLPHATNVTPTEGGDVFFAAGTLRGCPGFSLEWIRLAGCGGIELGWLGARGFGVDRVQEASSLWVAARGGILGALRIVEPLFVRLDVGLTVPFLRPIWVLDEIGTVDQPTPVTLRAEAGFEVVF